MCPLPTTRVFDPRWSGWHRPVAEGQMTAICTITRPVSPGVWNDAAGKTTWLPDLILYSGGTCRVQVSNRPAKPVQAGDAQLTQARYMVSVPVGGPTAPLQINDQVRLDTCDDDPSLIGKPLCIAEILQGSLLWQRDLLCELLNPATR